MIALTFGAPLLLIGLAAAGIPPLLHLISSVRAREQYFPTLRFLRLTMEKTARRRRLRNWLLLLLRSLALAVLAMAVAQPISEATGGWLGGSGQAAVVVLDDTYSMTATPEPGGESLFARARADASALLSGENKPRLAALTSASLTAGPAQLTGQLDLLRQDLAGAAVNFGPPSLTESIVAAVEALDAADSPDRSLYLLTDSQAVGLDADQIRSRLAGLDTQGMHVFVVRRALSRPANVGVTDLQLRGPAVVDAPVEIVATLTNAAPTPRNVEVELRIADAGSPQRIIRTLAAAGESGETAAVTFQHRFDAPGPATGEVRIVTDDDLPADNVRYLAVNVARRATALVVAPPRRPDAGAAFDPAAMLRIALDWRDPLADQDPWPIRTRNAQANALDPADLAAANAAFFAEVPAFDAPAAEAVADFVRRGGTAVFFLGPQVDAENYNTRFGGDGGLLPGRLGEAVGQVGVDAGATPVARLDVGDPLLCGLFDRPADYPTVLVQRSVQFERGMDVAPMSVNPAEHGRDGPGAHGKDARATAGRVLMELADGRPLMVAQPFGEGRVIWCMTTASPRWANLSTAAAGVFVPMVVRAALNAATTGRDALTVAGSAVAIDARPPTPETPLPPHVEVVLPPRGNGEQIVRVEVGEDGRARLTDTARPGLYRWSAETPDAQNLAGVFAVNPWGRESRLTSLDAPALRQRLIDAGFEHVYVGEDLDAVHAAARDRAIGRNWWDLLAAAVVVLLVAEALVANRCKARDLTPRQLNPTATA